MDAAPMPDAPPADVRPPVCTPGAQVACACVGGGAGAQVCAPDGASLGACACPDGGADGGVDAETDGGTDAAPDVADAATPTDTPPDAATDTAVPSDVPTDVLVDVPTDVLVDAPSDVARDAPADAPGDVPTDTPPDRPCSSSLPTDPANCGICGNICPPRPNSAPACVANACTITCATGFSNCDSTPANGCEAQTSRDPLNCGACGNVCTPPAGRVHVVPTCGSGGCGFGTCADGFGDCDGFTANGCETAITTTTNCGVCGRACGAGQSCTGGTCR